MVDNLQNQVDPGANVDLIFEGQDIYDCKYCSVDDFKSLKRNFISNGLSVICFNIRSYHKKLEEFLAYLNNCDHTFDVIILTETWSKTETNSFFHIPGYIPTHNSRNGRNGGGVSIFCQ